MSSSLTKALLLTMQAIMLSIFLVDLCISPGVQEGPVDRLLGLNYGLIEDGEWWRLITAVFLNGNPGILGQNGLAHLIVNSCGLWVFGPPALTALKSCCSVLFVLVSLFVPYAMAYIFSWPTDLEFSGGTSPAVWALMGVTLWRIFVGRMLWMCGRSLLVIAWGAALIVGNIGNLILGGFRISIGVHLAGLVLGSLAAGIIGKDGGAEFMCVTHEQRTD